MASPTATTTAPPIAHCAHGVSPRTSSTFQAGSSRRRACLAERGELLGFQGLRQSGEGLEILLADGLLELASLLPAQGACVSQRAGPGRRKLAGRGAEVIIDLPLPEQGRAPEPIADVVLGPQLPPDGEEVRAAGEQEGGGQEPHAGAIPTPPPTPSSAPPRRLPEQVHPLRLAVQRMRTLTASPAPLVNRLRRAAGRVTSSPSEDHASMVG